uniref:RloB domain-containing protein n=1 Tax=uncultured Ruegeria sp. TaxID=259304 RepID=UPI0026053805
FGLVFAIRGPPFHKHNDGPVQLGRLKGYAAMLQSFAEDSGLHVHLELTVPGRAGSAQVLVSKAITLAQAKQRVRGNKYSSKYIILDTDWLSPVSAENTRMKRRAEQAGFKLVFQDCCFEAFLLRHFEATQNAAPPNAEEAFNQLSRVWEGYRKGLAAKDLMKKLNADMVRSAAMRPKNRDFEGFLRDIGLL